MKNGKKGISFVEVIVSVAILIIISVVAVTTRSSMVDKTDNSKIISDMTSLENSLTSYKNDTNKIPTPNGNLKYFKEDTSYAHDITDAFAVSGFVTEKTIPKKYINYLPLDPKTGQYYALSTTKDESSFEIAGILKNNESYKSKVSGNWSGESGPYNLIREYNGPNFVYDESIENFPYNPEELLLTARISDYSGSLLINSKTYTKDEVLSLDLREGDKIEVGTGSSAEMYLSDGSYSTLGDISTKTEVVLANMRYVEENNLFTSVKIALNMGSIWTKASSLGEKSDYEIYTTDTVASVRGTIFGVNSSSTKSDISVIEGKVEVNEITSIPEGNTGNDFDNLTKAIQEDKIDEIGSENVGEIPGVTNGSGVIVVEKGEDPKAVEVVDTPSTGAIGGARGVSGTGVIEKLPEDIKDRMDKNEGEINNSIRLKLLELSNTGRVENRYVKIGLTDTLRKGNIVKINEEEYKGWILTGSFLPISGRYLKDDMVNISICKNKKCSKKLKVDFTQKIAYKDKNLEEDTTETTGTASLSHFTDECGENIFGTGSPFKIAACGTYNKIRDFNIYKYDGDTLGLNSNTGKINDCVPTQSSTYYFNNSSCVVKDTPGDIIGMVRFNTIDQLVSSKYGTATGVFLDNNRNFEDYLKYDVNSLNLNSGSGFAIEIGVRGSALKNRVSLGTTHFLATSDNTNNLKLGLFNGNLSFGGVTHNLVSISGSTLQQIDLLETNEFYKVIAEYDKISGVATLSILDKFGEEKTRGKKNLIANPPSIENNLFIGSSNSYPPQYQWNDIIDYVKIYRK